jgi:hypothetical protein
MSTNEQWVPMSHASKVLGVSVAKLSGMVKSGEIKSKKRPRDKRFTMVDLNELTSLFGLTETTDN